MILAEIIKILKDDKIKQKGKTISKMMYGINSTSIIEVLKRYGVYYDKHKKVWIIEEDKVEPDVNIKHLVFFGDNKYLTIHEEKLDWSIPSTLIGYEEILKVLNIIQNHPNSRYKDFFRKTMLRKIAIYIIEFFHHPLDALLVDRYKIERFFNGNYTSQMAPYLADMVRTVAFCLALKYKVKIPFALSSKIFSDFINQSIITRTKGDNKEEIKLTSFSYTLLKNIVDGEQFYNLVYETIIVNKKYINVAAVGGNLFYYVIMFLLDKGKSSWSELNLSDIEFLNVIHLRKIGGLNERNISSINLIIYLKTGINNFIPVIKMLDEIIHSDEVSQLFRMYRFYLKINRRSLGSYKMGSSLLGHKPSNIKKVEDLTKDNIIFWIKTYTDYAIENNAKKNPYKDRITMFLSILLEIKNMYENENIFGIYYEFPFNAFVLGTSIRKRKHDQDKSFMKNSVFSQIKNFGDVLEEGENLEGGTFKTDIQYADEIVRAIYNYRIEEPEESIEYFNELQKITLLRIIADSGVRSLDAVNTPLGTHSYIKEQGVDIIILGWSKLFERFGVVPISQSTGKMIEECTRIRKEKYSHTIVKMPIQQTAGSKAICPEYVMQFVSIHPKGYAKRINQAALIKQLDKVCRQVGIKLKDGKKLHLLRHRVAEYFFFCASYYDFDGKNDFEYKETIVKKLLRHKSNEMTKEYYWGELTNLIAEKKLVFYKDLSDLNKYSDVDGLKAEVTIHKNSLVNRIRKDLDGVFSAPNTEKLVKLFTLPINFLDRKALEEASKNQNFKYVIENLVKVDGNKSPVPVGAAYFGRCLNFSCPKLKEKITCVSCSDHIVTEEDVPRMIKEIIRCNSTIQSIYLKYDNTTHIDHLKSLRSRVASNLDKLQNDLQLEPLTLVELIKKYHIEVKEEVSSQ